MLNLLSVEMDPWNSLTTAMSFASGDSGMAQIAAAKKALQLLANNSDLVIKLCLACAENDAFTVKDLLQDDSTLLNKLDKQGVTPLIYAICFNHKEIVELLLAFKVDVNEQDKLIAWTPVMWATNFDYEDILERLISYGADPLKKSNKSSKNATDIAKKGSKSFEYFKIHGYIRDKQSTMLPKDDFYKDERTTEEMQSLSLKDRSNQGAFVSNERVEYDPSVENITFNFNIVTKDQYMKFNTDSIPSILEFISSLQSKYHTKPIYPSSIIFQCMRYAEYKQQSPSMVKNIVSVYLATIRKHTDTTSGVAQFIGIKERKQREKERKKTKDPQPAPKSIDIMTIGYWISAINHLYYFMTRDSACAFFSKYPDLLQEVVSCLHLLTSKLAFTMDEKLEPLVEECILRYNSVPDTEVLYQNDWKIFKNKNKQPKTSFEEVVDVLYPPTIMEQMKPSPIKLIQILGALLYVMELYHINDIIKQQCLTHVLYWLGCTVFNTILENKKYCSRVKAMEIRLNMSYIEDWLRSNNFQPFIEKNGDINTVLHWKTLGFPDNLSGSRSEWLQHVARYKGDISDPNDATFYYNPLFKIGHYAVQPVLELTEWLQVLSSMSDEQSVIDIADNFEMLNHYQLVQCIRNYNYEVDEKRFSKSLKKWLKEFQITPSFDVTMFHKNDSKDQPLYLNSLEVFLMVLPNTVQLLHQYGADFDHIDRRMFVAYQPNIPLEIRDEVETVIEEFVGKNRYMDDDDDDVYSSVQNTSSNETLGESDKQHSGYQFADDNRDYEKEDGEDVEKEEDDIFNTREPATAASWQNEGANPWA